MRKHWTEAVKAENEALRKQLQELRQEPMLRTFARAVADSIMVQLVNKPYNQWPDEAKRAFEHEAERTPVPAHFYKLRLRQ
jgi:hypothetical protein